jgi:hypothetical protein
VYDLISNVTAEEHLNDEEIHTHIDEFATVALTGDYNDLDETPDIPEIISNSIIDGGTF